MKKYDSYKDSGIEWLKEIPNRWNLVRMRYVCDISTGDKDTINREESGNYPFYVRSKNIERISTYTYDEEAILTPGDGDICKIWHYVNGKFECHQRVYKLAKFNQVTGRFLYYFLMQNFEYEVFKLSAKSTVDSLRRHMFQNFPIAFGTLEEQNSITNFLDSKTIQIDHIIAQKEALIQLLEEEKVAIINQAVTKGLDPSVPMKDSGIEWLGDIPEHWEVKSFRFCINILTDYTANGSFASLAENVTYYERGYSRLVRLTDLRVDLENEGLYVDEQAHNFLKKSELFGGELLIANVGAYAGLVKQMPIKEGKHTLGPNMFLLRINQNTEFFINQLNSPFCSEQLKIMAVSSAQPKLNKENIRQLKVLTPPLEEQNYISIFIKDEMEKVKIIIDNAYKEIEILKEYKTALFSEVVTGKVDVRNEKIR